MPKMFRALEDGFDGCALRKQGDEFQAADDFKAPWAKPLDAEVDEKGGDGKSGDGKSGDDTKKKK